MTTCEGALSIKASCVALVEACHRLPAAFLERERRKAC